MIDKIEVRDIQFLQNPEKPELSLTLKLIDYFGWWDKNNNGLVDSIEWRVLDEYFESFYLQQGIKAIRLGGHGDITMTNFLWGHTKQSSHVPSPLYYKNNVYTIRDGGVLSCFNSENGTLLFEDRIGIPGAYFSSPVVANGKIYVASRNGKVTVIEAGD